MASMGPVEYVVIAFPGNQFKGEIVPAVAEPNPPASLVGQPRCDLRCWELAGGLEPPNPLFTRQPQTVRGVLACAVLQVRSGGPSSQCAPSDRVVPGGIRRQFT
jgi:hypothetical protein